MSTQTRVLNNNTIQKIMVKMCNENNIDINNVSLNKKFGYIETIDFNKKDLDFCTTNYKGQNYKVKYIDGCFNPFMFQISIFN
jgi:hypothetical protein